MLRLDAQVILDCGLVVAFHELRRVKEARIRTGGDGSIRYKVDFTLVVFRPFPGEILEGFLTHSDRQGLRGKKTKADHFTLRTFLLLLFSKL